MRVLLSAFFIIFFAVPQANAEGLFGFGRKKKETKVSQAAQTPGSFADLAETLLPAVVNISSTQTLDDEDLEDFPDMPMPQFPPGSPFEDFFEDFFDRRGEHFPSLPQSSLGSGFVIDGAKGYVITNYHVVKDADEVRVTFHDESVKEAEVIGRDEKTDLAVLKVDVNEGESLTSVTFGDSSRLRVGDWTLAIGNPFSLGGTVTAGIVSARQRDIQAGPYDDFIQTDASINRGNSGGPLFDLNGKVIGINTAIFSPSGGSVGIGFAIPSNLAQPLIRQLIEFGHTRRGWLGVRIQTVSDEIAESLGLDEARGAMVADVTAEGPAEKVGLEMGDVILSFDGKKISEMRQLPRIVADTPIGKEVELTYWRDGKERTATVVIGELEKAEEDGLIESAEAKKAEPKGKSLTLDKLGLTMRALSPRIRQDYDLEPDMEGVLITRVNPASRAARKGLMRGDVILELNQEPVHGPEDVAEAVEAAEEGGRKSVLLLVYRDGDTRFVALRLKKKK